MFSISRIQQLIKPISRGRFKRLAEQHQADRYVKRFDSWQHLLAMLYAQCSGAGSLRLLPAMLRAGALRFWVSRLWDWHLPREASMLKPHDPRHFERVLRQRVAAPLQA